MARDQANDDDTWIVDSGASHHITSDLQNLSLHFDYGGNEDIMIGDGNGIPITHAGSTTIDSPKTIFSLDNDLSTRASLVRGQNKGNVYEWPTSSLFSTTKAFLANKPTMESWDCRLGHPSSQVLTKLVSTQALPMSASHIFSSHYSTFLSRINVGHLHDSSQKAIYDLRQAPHAWYTELQSFLLSIGFIISKADNPLFINRPTVYYHSGLRFFLKDLGHLAYFLRVEAIHTSSNLFFSQYKYIRDLLEKHNMLSANVVSTPISSTMSLKLHDGAFLADPTKYRQIIGSMQCLFLS
ncbi:Retrovirus-related Pol polyprotein from transposon RE1 [Vitis vinifera]|uniref:Retrovirus-related Pol polyprotein from transposon RE1 n=1 Tax=Vitis vinifera TaxID=29760 RepID=A0A438FWC1_VITVI|nr:Retrovirus-related Pol polyprotein from transposon RE1 [Vitis vinifera]